MGDIDGNNFITVGTCSEIYDPTKFVSFNLRSSSSRAAVRASDMRDGTRVGRFRVGTCASQMVVSTLPFFVNGKGGFGMKFFRVYGMKHYRSGWVSFALVSRIILISKISARAWIYFQSLTI